MFNQGGRPPGKASPLPDPYPAPGDLEVIQAYVNTAGCGSQSERLATPRDLSRWLTRRTLLPAGTELTEEDRLRALEVRDGIRAYLLVNSGGKLKEDVIERLDRAISAARFQLRFDRDGTARFEPASPGVEDALGSLLEIVVVAARLDGTWPRLKLCADPACRRAFYDTAKNGGGKWCTKRCGDKIRSRLFRRRRPGSRR